VEELGWEEWINRGGMVAVEWGDKFSNLFPETTLKLVLEFMSEEIRRVFVEATHPDSIPRVEELILCWPP
jgi:tRNA A37 threonylcarbamoyladenosine biosynthesis protein TsaE